MFFLGWFQVLVLAFSLFGSWKGALCAALLGSLCPFLLQLPWRAALLFSVGPWLAWGVGRRFRQMEHLFLEGHQALLTQTGERLRQKREGAGEKKAATQTLEKRVGEIVTLYELTKKLTASLELSEIFGLLQEALRANLSFQEGWLFLIAETETDLVLERQLHFSANRDLLLEEAKLPKAPPFLESLLGEAIRQRKPLHVEPAKMAVPLLVKNELNGLLVLENFSPAQEESLLILTNQFAPAIQKVKLYEKIQQLAITDGLTRVYTRRYFLERFQEEVARSKRYRLTLSFLMADIDHFKDHNDRCGHLVGDVVLREVASLIKANVREIDLVGRYGGEEFAVVLPDTPLEGALQVAERIRSAIEAHEFVAYDEALHVTLSLGISDYPQNGEEPMTLIDIADSALYHAKRGGRNRVSTSRMLTS